MVDRDIILICEEGVMRGVFGAGVFTALGKAEIYPRIHSVYGSSSGAHNGAYFLSQQLQLGSSIYYEDLVGDRFINKKRFWKLFKSVVSSDKKSFKSVADLDYLEKVEAERKKLNVVAIKNQQAHFFIRVYNIRKNVLEYLDGKQDTLRALKATASSSPYYPWTVKIRGEEYIDGSMIRNKTFLDIIAQNPDKKIMYVINNKKTFVKTLRELPLAIIEAIMISFIINGKIALKVIRSKFNYPTVKELFSFSNVSLAVNEKNYSYLCTDKKKLLEMYNHGVEKGEEALTQLI